MNPLFFVWRFLRTCAEMLLVAVIVLAAAVSSAFSQNVNLSNAETSTRVFAFSGGGANLFVQAVPGGSTVNCELMGDGQVPVDTIRIYAADFGTQLLSATPSDYGFSSGVLVPGDSIRLLTVNGVMYGNARAKAHDTWLTLLEYFTYGFLFAAAIYSTATARRLLLKLRGWAPGGDI